jgi:REP element-mobilizing transposase RayT
VIFRVCPAVALLDSFAHLRTAKRTQLNAFVVTPTHLHAILWPEEDVNPPDVLRDFKRFTSRSTSKEASRLGNRELLDLFAAARQQGRAQDVS